MDTKEDSKCSQQEGNVSSGRHVTIQTEEPWKKLNVGENDDDDQELGTKEIHSDSACE